MNTFGTKGKLVILVIIVIIGLGAYLYDQGLFEPQPNLAGAKVIVNYDNSILIADDKLAESFNLGGGSYELKNLTAVDDPATENINEAEHIIIVAAQDRWPWARSFTLPFESERTFEPILMRKVPVLTASDQTVDDPLSPTPEDPLVRGNIELYIDDTSVFMEWTGETDQIPDQFCLGQNGCEDRVLVIGVPVPITGADFISSERSDVVLFSTGNVVYATDTADGEFKNVHPVYISENEFSEVAFQRIDNDNVLIKDGDKTFAVEID